MSNFTISDESTEPPSTSTPFDKPFVDIILRSSDGVVFHALQSCLSDASQVFEDMFLVAQPHRTDALGLPGTLSENEVGMQESRDVIRALVTISHPFGPPPAFASFDAIKPFLDMWPKYDWRGVALERAERVVEPFLRDEPLRVYAYAVGKLPEGKTLLGLAKKAARACLRFPAFSQIDAPELDMLSARGYRRLLAYRDACVSKITVLKTIRLKTLRSLYGDDCALWGDNACHRFPALVALKNRTIYASQTWDGKVTDSYFRRYYGSMISKLLEAPHPSTVLEGREELTEAIKIAATCPSCARVAFEELPKFQRILANVVENIISQVELDWK
ncbi:hypothetical protein C8Q70DRAFT_238135 [Cubamyces menziesii]|nr:hypothetical protein C8Q70DRAFT_238135 [Cubamyces menziesii]